ncbi:lactonase family protein [Cupriavidus sp. TMH.W2]|uniref:lactonase family protein n=1 Tax=Cupriavidus sp. TMH.W2 TaxID=3434465 RepID=UPI003D777D6F
MNHARILLAVGTYTQAMPHVDGKGLGIHMLAFDPADVSLKEVALHAATPNPSYLAASARGDRLYGVRELGAADGAAIDVFAIEEGGAGLRPLASIPVAGADPCFLSVDDGANRLYVANYTSGEVLAFSLDPDRMPRAEPVVLRRHGSGPRKDRQEGPHAHCAVAGPDGTSVYLCDLGTDTVARHPIRGGHVATAPDLELRATPGAGPRHLAFDASGDFLFIVNELSSTVALYRIDAGEARKLCEASTLPPAWTGASTAAAIRVHPGGGWVYASNRGHDSIAALRVDRATGSLVPAGWWPAGGRTPRDFVLTPDGAFLLAAAQDDALIRIFRVDARTGALTHAGRDYRLQSPACLCLLPRPGF